MKENIKLSFQGYSTGSSKYIYINVKNMSDDKKAYLQNELMKKIQGRKNK